MESSALGLAALSSLPGPYVDAFVAKLGPKGLPSLLTAFDDKMAFAEHRIAFSVGPGQEPKVCSSNLTFIFLFFFLFFFLSFNDIHIRP